MIAKQTLIYSYTNIIRKHLSFLNKLNIEQSHTPHMSDNSTMLYPCCTQHNSESPYSQNGTSNSAAEGNYDAQSRSSRPLSNPHNPSNIIIFHRLMKSNGQSTRLSLDSLRKHLEHYSYSTHEKLGSGYSSEVFRGRDDCTGKPVAIKVVNLHRVRQKNQEELLLREVRLLQQIKHPNLLGCLDALMTSNNCYIVTQYCSEGDLGALLTRKGRLTVDLSLPILHDVATAVTHLHSKSVIHRDIKPHNILMHRNRAKLADFGFATRCETSIRDGYKIGSPLYMSPEALNDRQYSRKSDVWALGVTFFEILEGRAPWEAKNENELKQSFNKQIQFKFLQREDLRELIRGCLLVDRDARLTAQEVLVRVEKAIGGPSLLMGLQMKENKENIQNGNNQLEIIQDNQQLKISHKNSYNILKWMINYSRFSSKYLPKVQQCALDPEIKEALVELTARCLHMTISKLKRIEQFHSQLGITHFQSFKRTSRFMKIRAVTEEYHQKYLVMLAKLPYKYSLGSNIALELTPTVISSLQKLEMNDEQSYLLQGCLTLIQANHWAKSTNLSMLVKMVNFEELVQKLSKNVGNQVVDRKIEERKNKILQELKENGKYKTLN